jgi:hydrogenase expression/formation protein HypE
MMNSFPVGKLPSEELKSLFSRLQPHDPRVLLGPGVGLDCAVIDFSDTLLVAKSDPITFTAEDIGWYAVQINANDIATTGARPRWFLVTILLPPEKSDKRVVDRIFEQLHFACAQLEIEIVGGHTEITSGLDRPIISGTMLGEVSRTSLITPKGAQPGDILLLSKGIPIEAGSILAREYELELQDLDPQILQRARDYLTRPGISIVPEALLASKTGGVTAMHDPTEGGLLCGLWELSEVAGVGLLIERDAIPIFREAKEICEALGVDPFTAIASGALLLCVREDTAGPILEAFEEAGIQATVIGSIIDEVGVFNREGSSRSPLPRPSRDALAELFERMPPRGSMNQAMYLNK